jgi:hypothetical protein
VDGINCGKICDAIANMPQHASKFQEALERAWQEKVVPSPSPSEEM